MRARGSGLPRSSRSRRRSRAGSASGSPRPCAPGCPTAAAGTRARRRAAPRAGGAAPPRAAPAPARPDRRRAGSPPIPLPRRRPRRSTRPRRPPPARGTRLCATRAASGLRPFVEREALSHLALHLIDVGRDLLVGVAGGAKRVPPLAIAEPVETAAGPQHVVDGDVVVGAPIQDDGAER